MLKQPVTCDEGFSRRVAALALRDDAACARISAMIEPEWVEDQLVADVLNVGIKCFNLGWVGVGGDGCRASSRS